MDDQAREVIERILTVLEVITETMEKFVARLDSIEGRVELLEPYREE